jgi:hypothetical protein
MLKMSGITRFALELLEKKEFDLALYLSELLCNPNCVYVRVLISEILPTFGEKRGESYYTLQPDPIYRPLYYLQMHSNPSYFKDNTRVFLTNVSAHLEGCLFWLTKIPSEFECPTKPFGGLVELLLKKGVLSEELAISLKEFNRLFNIPSKHFKAFYKSHSRLDERTFSCYDAAVAFMAMRKLSIELFKLLTERGVNLPHGWREFDDKWLSPKWASKRDNETH